MAVGAFPLYHRGACQGEDIRLFFPPDDATEQTPEQVEKARAICESCDVTEACLSWALNPDQKGFAGGKTYPERAKERKRRQRRAIEHRKREADEAAAAEVGTEGAGQLVAASA